MDKIKGFVEVVVSLVGLIMTVFGAYLIQWSYIVGGAFAAVGLFQQSLGAWMVLAYFFGYMALSVVLGLIVAVIGVLLLGKEAATEVAEQLRG